MIDRPQLAAPSGRQGWRCQNGYPVDCGAGDRRILGDHCSVVGAVVVDDNDRKIAGITLSQQRGYAFADDISLIPGGHDRDDTRPAVETSWGRKSGVIVFPGAPEAAAGGEEI